MCTLHIHRILYEKCSSSERLLNKSNEHNFKSPKPSLLGKRHAWYNIMCVREIVIPLLDKKNSQKYIDLITRNMLFLFLLSGYKNKTHSYKLHNQVDNHSFVTHTDNACFSFKACCNTWKILSYF